MPNKSVDYLSFNKRLYKCRRICFENSHEYLLASTILSKKLITTEGSYTSDYARYIDEKIVFFISPYHFRLDDAALIKILQSSYYD